MRKPKLKVWNRLLPLMSIRTMRCRLEDGEDGVIVVRRQRDAWEPALRCSRAGNPMIYGALLPDIQHLIPNAFSRSLADAQSLSLQNFRFSLFQVLGQPCPLINPSRFNLLTC